VAGTVVKGTCAFSLKNEKIQGYSDVIGISSADSHVGKRSRSAILAAASSVTTNRQKRTPVLEPGFRFLVVLLIVIFAPNRL
jgi:hypothetical protein